MGSKRVGMGGVPGRGCGGQMALGYGCSTRDGYLRPEMLCDRVRYLNKKEGNMSNVIAAFSIEQVATLAGLSYDRLTRWDSEGFFVPSLASENRKVPYSRIYTFEDVVSLRTLSILRSKVSMQHLRVAADVLKKHAGKPWSELALYVLNREVHFTNPSTQEIEGTVGGQRVLPIKLDSVAEEMMERAEQLRHRDANTIGRVMSKRYVMGGVECVAGTRVPVATIRRFSAAGYSSQQIRHELPVLELKDIKAVLSGGSSRRMAA